MNSGQPAGASATKIGSIAGTAVIALLPALVCLAVTRRRVGLPALITLLALVLSSTALLNASSGGWYGYFVFSELLHQQVVPQLWVGFWRDDILHQLWPLVILIVGGGSLLACLRG